MRQKRLLIASAAVLALAACSAPDTAAAPSTSVAPSEPAKQEVRIGPSALGPILTDAAGRTLYAFTPDKEGPGTCTDDCAATWPPLISTTTVTAGEGADSSLLTMVNVDGGVRQASYGGWRLYTYAPDVGPGDVDGQGEEGGLWWVVDVQGKLVKKMPTD